MTHWFDQVRRLLAELKHRRVFRVAAVYAGVAFVVLQGADLVFPSLGLPDWTMSLLVVLALFGFPLALVLAWAFDVTPDGVRRAEPTPSAPMAGAAAVGPGRRNPRRGGWFVLGLLVALMLGWYGVARMGGGEEPEASGSTVAVLPFRVAGADPSLSYLREGMVDLLAAKLTGEWGPRAVDPRTLMSAWRRAVPREEEDLPPEGAASLARGLGAGQVVLGEVVSAAGRLVVTASVVDVATGRMGTPVTAEGPADSLPALVDRLAAAMLTRQSREAEHRLTTLTSTSLPALRSYLRARADYRRGRFDQALEGFLRAVELDSTFVLAAMGANRSAIWAPQGGVFDNAVALELAWRHRHRLSGRDLVRLEAMAGPRYPTPATARERLQAWERVAQQNPDDPEAWYEVGDAIFHHFRFFGDGALERAARAFRRAYDLDPSFGPARLHVHDAAHMLGDTAVARSAGLAYLAEDSTSYFALFMRATLGWLDGRTEPDPALLAQVDRTTDLTTLIGLMMVLPLTEPPPSWLAAMLSVAERARESVDPLATTLEQRAQAAEQRRAYALNRGRTAEALRATRELATLRDDPLLEARLNVLAALYWDGDARAGREGAARLERALSAAGGPEALAATERGRAALCALAQWRLAAGEGKTGSAVDGVAGLAPAIRSGVAAEAGPAGAAAGPSSDDMTCADLVEAWAAHVEERPEAEDLIHDLDRRVGDGGPPDPAAGPVSLVLARLFEERNDLVAAYRAARRVVVLPGGDRYGSTRLREQGHIAERLGDNDAAARAYSMYLLLHDDPDPGPAAAAATAVRDALAGQVERGGGAR